MTEHSPPRRRKPRRSNLGRRRSPESDTPQAMTEDELTACVNRAQELGSGLLQQGNVANAKQIVADLQRLVTEVRRLRTGHPEAITLCREAVRLWDHSALIQSGSSIHLAMRRFLATTVEPD